MLILGKVEEESMPKPPSFSPPEFPRAFIVANAIAMQRAGFRVALGAGSAVAFRRRAWPARTHVAGRPVPRPAARWRRS